MSPLPHHPSLGTLKPGKFLSRVRKGEERALSSMTASDLPSLPVSFPGDGCMNAPECRPQPLSLPPPLNTHGQGGRNFFWQLKEPGVGSETWISGLSGSPTLISKDHGAPTLGSSSVYRRFIPTDASKPRALEGKEEGLWEN